MNYPEKRTFALIIAVTILVSGIVGGLAGFLAADSLAKSRPFLDRFEKVAEGRLGPRVPGDTSVATVAANASPAVVSIIVSKDLPKLNQGDYQDFFQRFMSPDDYKRMFGREPASPDAGNGNNDLKQEVGGGSGFFVSANGLIVTNKHVVQDESAEYTVVTSKGDRLPAKVLGRDPSNDLAVLKVEGKDFPTLELGDSASLKPGQSVVAIGNALGEFSNTVSSGVISGLSRSITAQNGGFEAERLNGLIQTDASINPGNSGGPLLDMSGKVIGINVAVAQDAQNIGFALPINQVKTVIDGVQKEGRIIRAWLGVRYIPIDRELAQKEKLAKDFGALVVRGDRPEDKAVMQDSPADRAGLKEKDIILEANGEKITGENPLVQIIAKTRPGDKLEMKVWRDGKELKLTATLEELKQ